MILNSCYSINHLFPFGVNTILLNTFQYKPLGIYGDFLEKFATTVKLIVSFVFPSTSIKVIPLNLNAVHIIQTNILIFFSKQDQQKLKIQEKDKNRRQ